MTLAELEQQAAAALAELEAARATAKAADAAFAAASRALSKALDKAGEAERELTTAKIEAEEAALPQFVGPYARTYVVTEWDAKGRPLARPLFERRYCNPYNPRPNVAEPFPVTARNLARYPELAALVAARRTS